eukprot:3521351-Lingulodinium_polyedra.AAC.1
MGVDPRIPPGQRQDGPFGRQPGVLEQHAPNAVSEGPCCELVLRAQIVGYPREVVLQQRALGRGRRGQILGLRRLELLQEPRAVPRALVH